MANRRRVGAGNQGVIDMRHLKMLVPAAAVVVVLIASIGAGSASATVLCTEAVNPCPVGKIEPASTAITANLDPGANAVFKSPTFTTECTASSWEAETANKGGGGERVTLTLKQLSFTECKCGTTTLTKVAHVFVEKIGFLEVESIGANNGTLLASETAFTIECTGIGSCKYGATSPAMDIGKLKGGNPATAEISVILPWIKGDDSLLVCGNSATLTTKYEITAPKPLYVQPS